jgi:hypothetical protein
LLNDAEAMSWWQRRRSIQLGPERRRRPRRTDEVT